MNKVIQSTTNIDHRNLINHNISDNKNVHVVVNDFQKKCTLNVNISSKNKKTIKQQVVDLNALNIQQSNKNVCSNTNNTNKEIGWFSVLDHEGYEGFLKEGHIKINKDRKLSINNYILLDINDQPIIVPENKKILIKAEGVIVTKEDTAQDDQTPVYLGQLKYLSLNNDDVFIRENGTMYDLSDSGIEKYKNNELEIKSKFLLDKISMKNDVKETDNFIKTLNLIRSKESNMKLDLDKIS